MYDLLLSRVPLGLSVFGIVVAEVEQVRGVDDRVSEERSHEGSGEREDGPEPEPDAGGPGGPDPSAGSFDLVSESEEGGREDDAEDGCEGASKEELFAEA